MNLDKALTTDLPDQRQLEVRYEQEVQRIAREFNCSPGKARRILKSHTNRIARKLVKQGKKRIAEMEKNGTRVTMNPDEVLAED